MLLSTPSTWRSELANARVVVGKRFAEFRVHLFDAQRFFARPVEYAGQFHDASVLRSQHVAPANFFEAHLVANLQRKIVANILGQGDLSFTRDRRGRHPYSPDIPYVV